MAVTGVSIAQYDLKVLVLGDAGAGKTSFINRYVDGRFKEATRPTLGGVDFREKRMQWDANTMIRLQLWDIAGQERLRKLARNFYTGAVGAFFAFDMIAPESFQCIASLKKQLDEDVRLNNNQPLPCVLLANKYDLYSDDEQGLTVRRGQSLFDSLDAFQKEHAFVRWFETSAKEGTNVDDAVRCLLKAISQRIDFSSSARRVAVPDPLQEMLSESVKLDDRRGRMPDKHQSRCCLVVT